MKQTMKFYIGIWAVLLLLFNLIAFLSVGWAGQEKYTAPFWTGYVFITLASVGQLFCVYQALKAEKLRKLFYNIPLIRISRTGLILSFIVGGACMLTPILPYWVAILGCAAVLAFTVIALLKASAAAELVEKIDEKTKSDTFFMRRLTADAEALVAKARTEVLKAQCKKVYEALRYSDPRDCDPLASLESKIMKKFGAFAEAVEDSDELSAVDAAQELLELLTERNGKAKLLK